MEDLKIGDKIVHKSNTSIKWIIESIDGDKIFCSTLIKETLEQKKEVFINTSIQKYKEPTISVISPKPSRNRW